MCLAGARANWFRPAVDPALLPNYAARPRLLSLDVNRSRRFLSLVLFLLVLVGSRGGASPRPVVLGEDGHRLDRSERLVAFFARAGGGSESAESAGSSPVFDPGWVRITVPRQTVTILPDLPETATDPPDRYVGSRCRERAPPIRISPA